MAKKSGKANKPIKTTRNSARVKITWRYILVSTVIVIFASCIAYSMFRTTVVDRDKWIAKANKDLERRDTIQPTRGEILAANGAVLATNLDYYTLRIDFKAPKFMEEKFRANLNELCDTLAKNHPIRTSQEWKDYFMVQLNKKPSERSTHYTLLKNLSFVQAEAVKNYPFFKLSKNANKTGLTSETVKQRCYPFGDMARRSIGRVGLSEKSGGKEVHGNSGLESALDSMLYGKPGLSKKVPLTHGMSNWTDVPSVPGYTLTTTIDIGLQDIVENELSKRLKELEAEWGTMLIMEVETGDIKAISNLERDKETGEYIEALNRAVQRFEPGSVVKAVAMVVALEEGFTKDPENEIYEIKPGYKFGGAKLSDTHYSLSKTLPVSRFLEYSSNIGMTKLVAPHYANNLNGYRERVRELGMMDTFKTGIAGEVPSYFPTLSKESGGLASLGRQTYGYATMISPLYICAFYNAIANDGKFVRPRLVSKIKTERGDSIIPVSYVREQMCSPKNAAIIRDMLRKAVYGEGGTAKSMKNDIVEIVGKTGTAKIAYEMSPEDRKKLEIDPNDPTVEKRTGYEDDVYRYAFCGFFPYDKPKYTGMVLISRPNPQLRPRNAAFFSGQVLLNVAKRMYSRGMLGEGPSYKDNVDPARTTTPVLYATTDTDRDSNLIAMLSSPKAKKLSNPQNKDTKGVPNVVGLGLREAIMAIESRGYSVNFEGEGTVVYQSPEPGTALQRGGSIVLKLQKQ